MGYPEASGEESLVYDIVYVKRLESAVRQMIEPLRNVPFRLVIESLSGHRIIPFNHKDGKDQRLLDLLKEVAKVATKNINKTGIRKRVNEVGNAVEPFIEDALNSLKAVANKPKVRGKTKAAGYPDLEFLDLDGRLNYLECKTFSEKTKATTQRSFYLSPSEDFKVTQDARHFVLSLEMSQDGHNVHRCKGWKIVSLEKLLVDVKHEFNSDNKRLYASELVLDQGVIP